MSNKNRDLKIGLLHEQKEKDRAQIQAGKKTIKKEQKHATDNITQFNELIKYIDKAIYNAEKGGITVTKSLSPFNSESSQDIIYNDSDKIKNLLLTLQKFLAYDPKKYNEVVGKMKLYATEIMNSEFISADDKLTILVTTLASLDDKAKNEILEKAIVANVNVPLEKNERTQLKSDLINAMKQNEMSLNSTRRVP